MTYTIYKRGKKKKKKSLDGLLVILNKVRDKYMTNILPSGKNSLNMEALHICYQYLVLLCLIY